MRRAELQGQRSQRARKNGDQDGRRDPHINAGPQKEANSRISITGPTGPPVYSGQPWPATTLSMGFDGSDQSWSEDQRRTASVQTTTLNEEKKEQFHSAVADRQGNTCTTTTQAPTSITHTILEVEADIPTDGCKQMRNYKRPIRLADYIQEKCDSEMRPTRCYTIDFKAHSGTGLWSLLQFGYQATYRKELPKEAHYKESTLTALGQMVELGHNQPIRLEVYTDGSAGRGREGIFKASWAYVILIIHDKGTELLHWESGPVETDRQSRDWMGAPRATAETAEIAALQKATIWLIHQQVQCETWLCFDNMPVGLGGVGNWSINTERCDHRALRALQQVLENQTDGRVKAVHVKAHQGHPWNELVDTLAFRAMREGKAEHTPHPDLRPHIGNNEGDRGDVEWWWLHFRVWRGDEQYPRICNGKMCWTIDTSDPPPTMAWTTTSPTTETNTILQIKLLQYNVMTLRKSGNRYQRQDGINHAAAYLRHQLNELGIHMAGFQETRARESATVVATDWIRLISSADDHGHGGCELWLNRSIPLDKEGRYHLSNDSTMVLAAQPELLVVKLQLGTATVLCVVAHAPHSRAPTAKMQGWWQDLRGILRRHPELPLITLVDANAHFSTAHPPHVGEHQLENKGNLAAEELLEYARQTGTKLVNTFETHQGPATTWVHPAHGTGHRSDYIGLPLTWCSQDYGGLTSRATTVFDLGTAAIDHVPLFAEASVNLKLAHGRRTSPGVLDTGGIRRMGQERLGLLMQQLPCIPWDCDVHSHGTWAVEALRGLLQKNFRTTRKPPYKPYIREETWQLRTRRVDLRRQVLASKAAITWAKLQTTFKAWARGANAEDSTNLRTFVGAQLQQQLAAWRALEATKKTLVKQLEADKTAFLEEVADQAQRAPGHEIFRHLRKAGVGGRNRRSPIQPLNLMIFDGATPGTIEEYREGWRKHFAALEDGELISEEELLRQTWARQLQREVQVESGDIPTLIDLERAFRITRCGKAYFYDGIPPEIAHHAAKDMASFFFSLFLKQMGMVAEPISFKGGILVNAYKGKGKMSDPNTHRALLVSSIVAKGFHKAIRPRLMHDFEQMALPLQLAGRPKMGVSQTAHAATAFGAMARKRGWSYGVLFIDITQAYYRVARQCVVHTTDFDTAATRLFTELGLEDTTFETFARELSQDAALGHGARGSFHAALADEILNGSWFRIRGDKSITVTNRGSRPGDSLADLLFNFAFRQLLGSVHEALDREGLLLTLQWSGTTGQLQEEPPATATAKMLGPIWADDLALLAMDSEPDRLLRKLKVMATRIQARLANAGMQVNFKAGKSEAVIQLRGPGAKTLRQELYRHEQPGFVFGPQQTFVRIVPKYTHLGTIFTATGDMKPEIRRRLLLANQNVTKYSKGIFGRRNLSLGKKITLFKSLVASGLWYNTATWPPLKTSEADLLDKGVFRLYRRILILHYGPDMLQTSRAEVFRRCTLPTAENSHRVERLRHLRQLITTGEGEMWALLEQERDWLALVRADLEWLEDQRRHPLPLDPELEKWEAWRKFLLHDGQRWPRVLAKASDHAVMQHTKMGEWEAWHWQVVEKLCPVDILLHVEAPSDLDGRETLHVCFACSRGFPSKAAWAVHAFNRHSRCTRARWTAEGTTCPVCMRAYHEHTRLLHHLRYSHECLRRLEAWGMRPTRAPGQNSRVETRRKENEHRRPVLRTEGPTRRGAAEDHADNPGLNALLTPYEQGLSDALLTTLEVPWQSNQALLANIRQTLRHSYMHIDELRTFLPRWTHELTEHRLHDQCEEIGQVMRDIEGRLTTVWVLNGDVIAGDQGQRPEKPSLQTAIRRMVEYQARQSAAVPPARKCKQVVLLHLFSGRRRPGDFQSLCEGRVLLPGRTSVALSVDVVIHEDMGNLLKEESTIKLLQQAILEGVIQGGIAGPPCETVSRARENVILDQHGQHRGPRPVRSVDHPMGLDKLTKRELHQVLTANALWGATWRLFAACIQAGATLAVEHPVQPANSHSPSMWRLELLRGLDRLPQVQKVTVYQGHFGAISPKPTTLMFSHPRCDAQAVMARSRTCHTLPPPLRRGKGEDGAYFTAQLKEYPSGFSAAVLEVICASLQQSEQRDEEAKEDAFALMPELGKLCAILEEQGHDLQRMGPDYDPEARARAAEEGGSFTQLDAKAATRLRH